MERQTERCPGDDSLDALVQNVPPEQEIYSGGCSEIGCRGLLTAKRKVQASSDGAPSWKKRIINCRENPNGPRT